MGLVLGLSGTHIKRLFTWHLLSTKRTDDGGSATDDFSLALVVEESAAPREAGAFTVSPLILSKSS